MRRPYPYPRYLVQTVDSNATVTASYVYDAYGNTLTQSGPFADANPYRFSSQYFDSETSLYMYIFRAYSPTLERWMNRDPIGEEADMNLCAFVQNNPLGTRDSLGLWSESYDLCTSYRDKLRAGDKSVTGNPWLDLYTRKMRGWGCPVDIDCHDCRNKGSRCNKDRWLGGWVDPPPRKYPQKGVCVEVICTDNSSSIDDTIAHELTHCLQACVENREGGCAGCLCREIQAYARGRQKGNRWGAYQSCSSDCRSVSWDQAKQIMTPSFVEDCSIAGFEP